MRLTLTEFCSATLVFLLLSVTGPALAQGWYEDCKKQEAPVEGEKRPFSLAADVNGHVAFDGTGCAIRWRNRELCAMETVAFDASALVIDYPSGAEIPASSAFFVASPAAADTCPRITAFHERPAAEEYAAQHQGQVMDFAELTAFIGN